MTDVKRLDINGTSYDIKAVSVVNNGSGGPVKQWTGSSGAYQAMVDAGTTDPDTYYALTDTGALFMGTKRLGGGDAYFARKDLDNLSDVGKNIGNWSTNVTNCITEIPQDIKVARDANGALTLLAGSKVYVPNGFESDGITPHFDVKVMENDIHQGNGHNSRDMYFCRTKAGNQWLIGLPITSLYVGPSTPTSLAGYSFWWDTSTNIMKYYDYGTSTWKVDLEYSLPICTTTGSSTNPSTTITSIDEVFNGFGYMANYIYVLPGVKYLAPNGRNDDGSLKNTECVTTKIATTNRSTTSADTTAVHLVLNSSGVIGQIGHDFYAQNHCPNTISSLWYDTDRNIMRISGAEPTFSGYIGIYLGTIDFKNTRVCNFNLAKPLNLLDMSYKDSITSWGFPDTRRYEAITVGASNTSYQAPADGYFYAYGLTNTGSGGAYIMLSQTFGSISYGSLSAYPSPGSAFGLRVYLPVRRGSFVGIQYNFIQQSNVHLMFVYAHGSEKEI